MKLLNEFEKWVREFAEDLSGSRRVSSTFSRLERESITRREQHVRNPIVNKFSRLLVLVIVASILAFFSQRLAYYFDWLSVIANDPHVFNLTSNKVVWDVHYGKSPMCGSIECHLTSTYPKVKFEKQMVLPTNELPLHDYKSGQIIYLRAHVRLPDRLRNFDGPLALQSIYIWAHRYELYINGSKSDEGGTETLFTTISKTAISADGAVNLAFRIDPGGLPYQGLANHAYLLLGPKEILIKAAFQATELKTTYYLWFLIPKLIFCLIFSALFIAVFRHKEVLYFILYGYASAWAIYINTDYKLGLLDYVAKARVADVAFSCIAELLLFRFAHEYYRRDWKGFKTLYLILAGVVFGVLGLYLAVPSFQHRLVTTGAIYYLREILRVLALSYGSVQGMITVLYLGKTGKSRFRMIACAVMGVFFLGSLIVAVEHYIGTSWQGLYGIKALIFDLLFFVAIAGVVAVEFGLSVTQKDFMKGAFGRFTDPALVDKIVTHREVLPSEEREITLMFTDIRSFTEICEKKDAPEVVSMLRDFRRIMVRVLKEHGAFIDKFVGDAIMAFWNAPTADVNHAKNAIDAALAMRKALDEFNKERANTHAFEISIGIGIATGIAIVGEIEGEEKTEYSAIGDIVNLAARVEGRTKIVGTDILISESTLDQGAAHTVSELSEEVKVAGKEIAVKLYKVIGAFAETGEFSYYGAVWDKDFESPTKPGLTSGAGKNLKKICYVSTKSDKRCSLPKAA